MPRKKASVVAPVSRQETIKVSLINEIITIISEVKKPVVAKTAALKLTAQQQAAVDSLNRNGFGCHRIQVIDLVSAIVGKDLSSLVTKEKSSPSFTYPIVLQWTGNDGEIGIGVKEDSDNDVGFTYIDSDGDACWDWSDHNNFEEATIDDLKKALTNAKLASVAKILSDLTEAMENK